MASSTGISPKKTMSFEALATPSRLRSVERATRITFSLGDALVISTSLAIRPTFELAISRAASAEYESDQSENSVWYSSCTDVDELDKVDVVTSIESGGSTSAASAALRPRIVATSACSPLIEAFVFADSDASEGDTSLSTLTTHSAKDERCRLRVVTSGSGAPGGAGAPASLPSTVAAFWTMKGGLCESSLSSGFIGSATPLVSTMSLGK